MRLIGRYFGLAAMLVVALGTAGCTGSEVIPSGNSNVILEVQVVNSDKLQIDYPDLEFFDGATMKIVQLTIRPEDPDADAALGSVAIGALTEDFLDISLTNPEPVIIEQLLSAGVYTLNGLAIRDVLLLGDGPLNRCDDDTPCDTDADCTSGICNLDSVPCGDLIFYDTGNNSVSIPNLGIIRVTGDTTRVIIEIDGQKISDAVVAAYVPSSCSTFSQSSFVVASPSFISVTVQ